MNTWTIAEGESTRVYLINRGRDAVGEIVYAETRRPADARLIAAAPDLLAALSEMLSASDAGNLDSLANAAQTARMAIAKAEGVTE